MQKTIEIKTLHEYLYWEMVERHVLGKDVAEAIGCDAATISRIINADGTGMRQKFIIPVAKWCGLNADQLWALLEGEANGAMEEANEEKEEMVE